MLQIQGFSLLRLDGEPLELQFPVVYKIKHDQVESSKLPDDT